MPEPRFWNKAQVCARLGIPVSSARRVLARLEKRGFPKMDPDLRRWDSVAVQRYLDAMSGSATVAPVRDYRGAGDGL